MLFFQFGIYAFFFLCLNSNCLSSVVCYLQAGTHIICLYNDMETKETQIKTLEEQVVKEREAARDARVAAGQYQAGIIAEQGLRADAQAEVEKLKEELKELKANAEREMKEAEQKGYDLCYNELDADYAGQVKDIYSARFREGAEWCHKMVLELGALPDDSAVRQMPDIPSELLVIPPTEEEPKGVEDQTED